VVKKIGEMGGRPMRRMDGPDGPEGYLASSQGSVRSPLKNMFRKSVEVFA
jgi:hypothetical protein